MNEIVTSISNLIESLTVNEGYELVRLKGKWSTDINISSEKSCYALLTIYNINSEKIKGEDIGLNLLDPTCAPGLTYISCTSGGSSATSCTVTDIWLGLFQAGDVVVPAGAGH